MYPNVSFVCLGAFHAIPCSIHDPISPTRDQTCAPCSGGAVLTTGPPGKSHTPVFMAALFTIAKIWKQPKCPPKDEWIKEIWYIYTMACYSDTKMNEIMSFVATWMDLEIIILSEVRQKEKDKHCMLSLICGI